MTITHIIYSFDIGGAENMLIDIINRQVIGHQVELIIVNDIINESLLHRINSNVNVISIGRKAGSRNIFPLIKLNYIILKSKPDIIHFHSFSLPKIIMRRGKGLWFTVHSLDQPLSYANHLEGIIAISKTLERDIKARCDCRVELIPNGIETSAILKKESNKQKETFKIVQIGRLLHEIKGQDILIHAIAFLDKMGIKDIEVDLIGDGPSKEYLMHISRELAVADRIHFVGNKDRDYIYSHLKYYNLLCQPSRTEGFGLSVAEAMAAKLPVLVAKTGGPWEILEQGKYGYGFECGNAIDCANRILEIKNDYSAKYLITEKAFLHIANNYSIDDTVKKYLQVYNSGCQNKT